MSFLALSIPDDETGRGSCPIEHLVVVQQATKVGDLIALVGGNECCLLQLVILRGVHAHLAGSGIPNGRTVPPTDRADHHPGWCEGGCHSMPPLAENKND